MRDPIGIAVQFESLTRGQSADSRRPTVGEVTDHLGLVTVRDLIEVDYDTRETALQQTK